MKTIVFLVSQLINSGPENVVFYICCNLDRRLYKPIVFSLKGEDPSKSIENKFKDIDVDIYHFDASTIELEITPWKIAKKIQDKITDLKCDILHVHCYHPNLVGVYIDGVKKIATVHQISGEDFLMKKGQIMGRYMKFRFDRTLKHYDRIVVLSNYMRNYYKGCCDNLIKIPNGVSRPKVVDSDISIEERGVHPVVLVTGTLSDRKNVTYLLSELKKSGQKFDCYILGSGVKYNDCLDIINGDSRFHMEGFKENVWEYLSNTDLYVSASKSEGLPMSVLEALNTGVPCLLSEIPPHSEIVSDLNIHGVELFELKEGALKDKFDDMICSRYNRKEIELKSKELYSSMAMTKLYESLYDDCLK